MLAKSRLEKAEFASRLFKMPIRARQVNIGTVFSGFRTVTSRTRRIRAARFVISEEALPCLLRGRQRVGEGHKDSKREGRKSEKGTRGGVRERETGKEEGTGKGEE